MNQDSLPSVSIFSLNCSSSSSSCTNRVTCASINDSESLIAAGFESNQVQIVPFENVKTDQNSTTVKRKRNSHLRLRLPPFLILDGEEDNDQDDGDKDHDANSEPKEDRHKLGDGQFLVGHSDSVTNVSFVPCSKILLSSSCDSTIRAWNVRTKNCEVVYSCGHLPGQPIWSIDTSPLGWYFATGSSDTTAKLWSPEYMSPLRIFAGHTSHVNIVKFHPNCKYVASGSSDSTIKLWCLNDAKCVRSFHCSKNYDSSTSVTCLSFSPDGHQIASSGSDKVIKIWDLRTGRILRTFRGHQHLVNHVTFNPSGSILSSNSFDSSIKLWPISKSSSNSSSQEPMATNHETQNAHNKPAGESTPLVSYATKHHILCTRFIKSSNLLLAIATDKMITQTSKRNKSVKS